MSKYIVSGSTLPSCCTVDMSFNKTFDSMNITLGVEEVLASLSDILSDYDQSGRFREAACGCRRDSVYCNPAGRREDLCELR